jgi:hypothetical protein
VPLPFFVNNSHSAPSAHASHCRRRKGERGVCVTFCCRQS